MADTIGHSVYDSIYMKIFSIGESWEAESRVVASQGLEGGGIESNCIMDMEFFFGVMKNLWK